VQKLYKGLEEIGLKPFVEEKSIRLPCLTTVSVPAGVDGKQICDILMAQGIEVAGGLGDTAGKFWRIGTFGINSSDENITRVVAALKDAMASVRH